MERILKEKESKRQEDESLNIEEMDTLVTEIEMLKFVLHLVMTRRRKEKRKEGKLLRYFSAADFLLLFMDLQCQSYRSECLYHLVVCAVQRYCM